MAGAFCPTLDPAQVAFFEANGYLALEAVTTAGEIAWLRGAYDEILADQRALRLRYDAGAAGGTSGVIDQIFLPERQRPELRETSYLANAQRLASELLGVDRSEVHYGGLMMIYKPAGDGRDVPWHQDEVYWEFPAQRCHSLSVWMPLDEVTPESGCMQFLPGSHQLDVLRYREPPGEPLVLDQPVDVSRAVACPLAPGGATFHHCRTLHYTAPNTSARPRRAFTTIFHGPRTERTPPLVRPWRGEHG
jgi:ectoine hydroxylase-related dioxygenase (phytanoyl-CoA dioxygenase family)